MVRPFGVAIGVANKEVNENNVHLHGEFFFVHFSTGLWYKSYTAHQFVLS
jgi:hypothetical protein